MAITGLTPEQRRRIDQAGDEPVPIEDPETREDFILMRRRVYDRLRQPMETEPVDDLIIEPQPDGPEEIDYPVRDPGPGSMASHPGMDRWPDEPFLSQEISAPFDLPRPGTPIRCTARPGPYRPPDPPLPVDGAGPDHG